MCAGETVLHKIARKSMQEMAEHLLKRQGGKPLLHFKDVRGANRLGCCIRTRT